MVPCVFITSETPGVPLSRLPTPELTSPSCCCQLFMAPVLAITWFIGVPSGRACQVQFYGWGEGGVCGSLIVLSRAGRWVHLALPASLASREASGRRIEG